MLGENLRRLRISCELTMAQIALRSGLSKSFVSYLENGKRRPSPDDLRRITLGCGYPLGRFISEASGFYESSEKFGKSGSYPILWPAPAEIHLVEPYHRHRPEILRLSLGAGVRFDFPCADARCNGYIISGRAAVNINEGGAELDKGDSFCLQQSFSIATGGEESGILMVIDPPNF
jgi:transcriptional regulator with XRE-family HTH domain